MDRRARTAAVAAGERRHVHHRRAFAEEGCDACSTRKADFRFSVVDLVEEGLVHFAERLARDHAAREVDEDVEPAAERDTDLVEHRLDRVAVGDVGLNQKGVAARVLDASSAYFFGGFAAAVVIDRDADAGARKRDRDRSGRCRVRRR